MTEPPDAPDPDEAATDGAPRPTGRAGLRPRAPEGPKSSLENDVNLFGKERGNEKARASLAYLVAFLLVLGGVVYAVIVR